MIINAKVAACRECEEFVCYSSYRWNVLRNTLFICVLLWLCTKRKVLTNTFTLDDLKKLFIRIVIVAIIMHIWIWWISVCQINAKKWEQYLFYLESVYILCPKVNDFRTLPSWLHMKWVATFGKTVYFFTFNNAFFLLLSNSKRYS